MAAITGLRGSGEFTTDFRPTNYRELFTLLEPNGTAPLNALLSMAGSSETDDPKFNHFRDEMPDRYVKTNATQTTSDTSIVVTSATAGVLPFIVAGTTLVNVRTGELMTASAVNTGTNTITVTRGIGGSGVAMVAGDTLAVAGFAAQEGSGAPAAVSFDPTVDYNYTQIFKTSVSITNTLKNTYMRTGSKEQEMLTKALKLHMSDIERSMFFGKRAEVNGNTAQPTRYTGGLLSQISAATTIDASTAGATAGKFTEKEFDRTLIETLFAYGSKEKVAFCGAKVIAHLQQIGKNRWQPTAVQGSYGVSMTRYSTFAGDLLVHLHPMFRQIAGMESSMIILDLPYLNYRYMKGRDTNLKRDVQAPDVDGSVHYYITECGLEMTQSKVHSIIKNWALVE